MKSNTPSSAPQGAPSAEADDAWENDLVWDLLRQSPRHHASVDFPDEVMKALKDSQRAYETSPWNKKSLRFAVASAVAAIAAAWMLSFAWWSKSPMEGALDHGAEVVVSDEFAPLEEAVTQQVLFAAADQLHDFSDTELVTLIGF